MCTRTVIGILNNSNGVNDDEQIRMEGTIEVDHS